MERPTRDLLNFSVGIAPVGGHLGNTGPIAASADPRSSSSSIRPALAGRISIPPTAFPLGVRSSVGSRPTCRARSAEKAAATPGARNCNSVVRFSPPQSSTILEISRGFRVTSLVGMGYADGQARRSVLAAAPCNRAAWRLQDPRSMRSTGPMTRRFTALGLPSFGQP